MNTVRNRDAVFIEGLQLETLVGIHPLERQVSRTRFEPTNRLSGRVRRAGSGQIGEGEPLLAPDIADAVDHRGGPFTGLVKMLSYSSPLLASHLP